MAVITNRYNFTVAAPFLSIFFAVLSSRLLGGSRQQQKMGLFGVENEPPPLPPDTRSRKPEGGGVRMKEIDANMHPIENGRKLGSGETRCWELSS